MSLSKSKCWYSNNCLHFVKRTVPLVGYYSASNSIKNPDRQWAVNVNVNVRAADISNDLSQQTSKNKW
jgi:hypothetical protein